MAIKPIALAGALLSSIPVVANAETILNNGQDIDVYVATIAWQFFKIPSTQTQNLLAVQL